MLHLSGNYFSEEASESFFSEIFSHLMLSSSHLAPRFQIDKQLAVLSVIFGLVGITVGSWASRIPSLQQGLQLSHSALSLVLFCGGLGAVLSSLLASQMMAAMGGSRTLLYSALALCGTLLLIGMAPSASMLMACVVLLGLSGGCYTVGANALASRYESTRGRPVMARLHACGCGGSMMGTVLGSAAATAHLKPLEHFLLIALPVAVLLTACCKTLEPDNGARGATGKKFALPNARLASLGVLAFCTAMAHNGIADWSGLFLKEQFDVAAGFAPLAFSIFSAAMLLGRIFGDRLKAAHGARLILSLGAVLSAAGLLLAVLTPSPHLALLGFASSGIGLSFAYPFIFSAVGKEGALALTGVATMSNLGCLAGPLILGALSNHLGIAFSIGFIGVLCIVMGVVASRSALLK